MSKNEETELENATSQEENPQEPLRLTLDSADTEMEIIVPAETEPTEAKTTAEDTDNHAEGSEDKEKEKKEEEEKGGKDEKGTKNKVKEEEKKETANNGKSEKQRTREILKKMTAGDDDEIVFNFKNFVGGELISHFLQKHILYILMLTVMAIIYVTNRYACQTEIVEQMQLTEKLKDRRLRAVVNSSALIEYTRRSNIQDELSDSTLQQTKTPHFYLKLKEEATEEPK